MYSRQEQTTIQGQDDYSRYATVLKFGASVMKTHGAGVFFFFFFFFFFFLGGGGGTFEEQWLSVKF